MKELTFESAIKESVESACEKTPGMYILRGRDTKRILGVRTECMKGSYKE